MRLSKKSGQAVKASAQHEEQTTNSRRQIRYPLRVHVAFRWSDSHGSTHRGRGWTQNVSEGGLLVRTEDCPKVGDSVDLTLRVPSLRMRGSETSSRMEMTGKVVRVVPEGEGGKHGGFAVSREFAPVVEENSQVSWQLWEVSDLQTN
jgi:Tfp pilus assembly protein PilZ